MNDLQIFRTYHDDEKDIEKVLIQAEHYYWLYKDDLGNEAIDDLQESINNFRVATKDYIESWEYDEDGNKLYPNETNQLLEIGLEPEEMDTIYQKAEADKKEFIKSILLRWNKIKE